MVVSGLGWHAVYIHLPYLTSGQVIGKLCLEQHCCRCKSEAPFTLRSLIGSTPYNTRAVSEQMARALHLSCSHQLAFPPSPPAFLNESSLIIMAFIKCSSDFCEISTFLFWSPYDFPEPLCPCLRSSAFWFLQNRLVSVQGRDVCFIFDVGRVLLV